MNKSKSIEVRIGTVDDFSSAVKQELKNSKQEKQNKTIIYIQPKDVPRLLSAKRLDLIHEIRACENKLTVSTLAKRLKRKQEAVSRDLMILNQVGLIELQRTGRQCHPIVSKINLTV